MSSDAIWGLRVASLEFVLLAHSEESDSIAAVPNSFADAMGQLDFSLFQAFEGS